MSQVLLVLDAEFIYYSFLLFCYEEGVFMRGDASGVVHTICGVFRDHPALVGIDAVYRALPMLLLAADKDPVDVLVVV